MSIEAADLTGVDRAQAFGAIAAGIGAILVPLVAALVKSADVVYR